MHPVQAAERAQMAAEPARRDQVATTAGAPRRQQSIMPNETREALKKLALTMRKASGLPAEGPAAPDQQQQRRGALPTPPGPATVPGAVDRRAEGPATSTDSLNVLRARQ